MWPLTITLLTGVLAQADAPRMSAPARLPESLLNASVTPAKAGSSAIRLTSFDPSRAELRWSDNRWQLEAGGRLLKDFGRQEGDAREAVRLVRALNLNQHGEIGSPRAVMEYWLSDGRAPSGPVPGLRAMPIQTASLSVEQVQGHWCVRDASRVLFNFGTQEGAAREALQVIQQHGFNRVGYIGRGAPSMLVFLSAQDSPTPAAIPRAETPTPVRVTSAKSPSASEPGVAGLSISPESLPLGRQLAPPSVMGASNPGEGVNRIPFEWRQLQVRREGRDWKLVSGPFTLADFGANERDARLAQSAIQFYRCSEHCRVGGDQPVFSYFLSAGQAPRGMMLGTEKIMFRPSELTVEKRGDGWVIGDATRTLFQFGNDEAAARLALRDIQFYRFDMISRIGRTAPHQLDVLVRSR